MSTRIHRAMGWGMPWEKFISLCKIDLTNEEDGLYGHFEKFTDNDLTVPDEVCKESFNIPGKPMIIGNRLLSKTFTEGNRGEAKIGSATDLYVTTGYDEPGEVIFFLSLYFRKTWYRYDDDLDYAFERWREGGARADTNDPRSFTTYTEYGHYPWTNFLMLEDGTPKAWENFLEIRKHPEWLPAVPSEIRWYLQHMKVLDDAGVNQLRPVIAQWWG